MACRGTSRHTRRPMSAVPLRRTTDSVTNSPVGLGAGRRPHDRVRINVCRAHQSLGTSSQPAPPGSHPKDRGRRQTRVHPVLRRRHPGHRRGGRATRRARADSNTPHRRPRADHPPGAVVPLGPDEVAVGAFYEKIRAFGDIWGTCGLTLTTPAIDRERQGGLAAGARKRRPTLQAAVRGARPSPRPLRA
jgi:hypothetical protein